MSIKTVLPFVVTLAISIWPVAHAQEDPAPAHAKVETSAEVKAEATEAVAEEPKVEVLRCEGCGAAVSYSEKARAPKCAFCGSVLHLETPSDPMEQTRHFLPFTVTRSQAAVAVALVRAGLFLFCQQ